jgi:hypothetical protein
MSVFFMTLLIMVCIVAAMSVGVILGDKPIKGTCGGMSALGMDTACDVCGGDPLKCDEEQERLAVPGSVLAYDAMAEKSDS